MLMKNKYFCLIVSLLFYTFSFAQVEGEEKVFQINNEPDSFALGTVTVVKKDNRITILEKKLAKHNATVIYKNTRTAKGFRLMLLNTNDRNLALSIRAKLLQNFPEQNVYMIFQSPYIKLKFGNFLDKAEAQRYRKQITSLNLVTGNIYILPEMIEVRTEKIEPSE